MRGNALQTKFFLIGFVTLLLSFNNCFNCIKAYGNNFANSSATINEVGDSVRADSQRIGITVNDVSTPSEIVPFITGIEPQAARMGTEITIYGQGFGDYIGQHGHIDFVNNGGTELHGLIVEWNPKKVKVIVPDGINEPYSDPGTNTSVTTGIEITPVPPDTKPAQHRSGTIGAYSFGNAIKAGSNAIPAATVPDYYITKVKVYVNVNNIKSNGFSFNVNVDNIC